MQRKKNNFSYIVVNIALINRFSLTLMFYCIIGYFSYDNILYYRNIL